MKLVFILCGHKNFIIPGFLGSLKRHLTFIFAGDMEAISFNPFKAYFWIKLSNISKKQKTTILIDLFVKLWIRIISVCCKEKVKMGQMRMTRFSIFHTRVSGWTVVCGVQMITEGPQMHIGRSLWEAISHSVSASYHQIYIIVTLYRGRQKSFILRGQ